MQQKDEVYSPNSPQLSIFMPWFLFDWLPDPLYTSVKPGVQDGRTAGQVYLAKKAHQLDPLLVRYIEQRILDRILRTVPVPTRRKRRPSDVATEDGAQQNTTHA